jgi:serine kinase of HPr protein (carbohydrate metabolism regulator)
MTEPLLVHGTAVAIDGAAVLMRGPSGAGKSDLALRLIDGGAHLIADDQTLIRREGERVLVRAPPAIRGLIEIRGLGILSLDAVEEAPLLLLVDLVAPQEIERLPARRSESILGVPLPLVALAPFEASAAAKLRLARRAVAALSPPAIIIP